LAFERVDLVAGDDLQHQHTVAVHVRLDGQQELSAGRALWGHVPASQNHNKQQTPNREVKEMLRALKDLK
jgi:hypothetical protein